jgi:hypothetical protein
MNVRGTTQRLQSSPNAQIALNRRMSEKRFPPIPTANKCRYALWHNQEVLVDPEKACRGRSARSHDQSKSAREVFQ